MRLIKINLDKINIEKLKESFKNIKINSKINISNIEILNPDGKDNAVLQIFFTYHITYSPDVANIDLGGKIILTSKREEAKEALEMWESKKMTEDFRISLFNMILRKANIKALELEEQVGLPLHIPLPTLKKQEKK